MNARRVAVFIVAAVALTGCAVPGRFMRVPVAPWNPTNAPWNSTLSGIASHYHVVGGYRTLARINGISDPFLLHVGQVIKVPRRHPEPEDSDSDGS